MYVHTHSQSSTIKASGTHISLLNLSGHVHPSLGRDEERGGRSVQEGICLCVHLCLDHAVCDLLQVDLCLHVHVLPSIHRLGGTCTKLLSSLPPGKRPPPCLLLPLQLKGVWLGRLQHAGWAGRGWQAMPHSHTQSTSVMYAYLHKLHWCPRTHACTHTHTHTHSPLAVCVGRRCFP